MTASIISIDNAPRDLAKLTEFTRAVRYRLALNLGICNNGTPEEQAFLAAEPAVQAQTILDALALRDAQGGAPQQPQAIQTGMVGLPVAVTPQPVVAQPMGQPVAQPPQPPQAVQPQVQQPQQMQAPPQPPAPQPQVQQLPAQQPPAPPAAVGPQTPATSGRQPVTNSDPQNIGAQPGLPTALQTLDNNLQTIYKAIQEQKQEVGTLKQLLLGSLRIQNTLTLIMLEVAESELATDKATIIKMVNKLISMGEPEKLFEQDSEGKD